jgi:anti-sigma B factor antagonist
VSLSGVHTSYLRLGQEEGAIVLGFNVHDLTEELNVEQLGHDMFQLVDQNNLDKLVLDLDGVRYLTSSVLGKFITLHRRLHRKNGKLVMCRPSEPIREILKQSRLLDYFHVRDTLPEAVQALH